MSTQIIVNVIPRRKIEGHSAILLPFRADGSVDWDAFCAHVARTAKAGLTPAWMYTIKTARMQASYAIESPRSGTRRKE